MSRSSSLLLVASIASIACIPPATPNLVTSPPSPVTGATPLPDLVPRLDRAQRIRVLPVLFVPADAPAFDQANAIDLLARHVELARAHYLEMLGVTFEVAGPPTVYLARHADTRYLDVDADTPDDRAHRILAELFAWQGTDRYTTDLVFLTIYVSGSRPIWAGARAWNGAPGTGGGYAELDLTSLLSDRGYPFQSTLVHELGHAFGLSHVDCHGRDLATSPSIMSANPAHRSSGLTRTATPGGLDAEGRFALAYAQRVFPGLTADVTTPAVAERCFQGPMAETVGPYRDLPGVGFELYYDGQRVNGPDAALYARGEAERSCAEAGRIAPDVRVACRYNGNWM